MAGTLRFEAWTLPTSSQFRRKILDLDALAGSTGRVELGDWSDDTLLLSDSYKRLDEVLSQTGKSWIRVLDVDAAGVPIVIDEFLAERRPRRLQVPGIVVLTGPQRNGMPSKMGIYPPDWPANPPRRPNWVWAGENLLDELKLGDLASIREQWELYLSGERYELDIVAVGGTYTLTVEGDTTAAIAYDATASQIRSALEDLPSVNSVSVVQPDSDTFEYFIVFESPKDLSTDMTVDTGGGAGLTLTKLNDGFDPGTDPTFTVTVDGETTDPLDWDTSLNAFEGSPHSGGGLQGLPSVSDVTVAGSGIAADPWVITFYEPPDPDAVSVTFAAGTAVLTKTQEGSLDPSPVTQSQYADERIDERIHGEYDDPPIEVVTDNLDAGADWALKVNAAGQFAGSQRTIGVDPGEIYQASIRVKPTVTGRYRLVIRDMFDELIKWHSPNEIELTAGTYQTLSVPDVVIPNGTTGVIMRVAVVSSDPAEIGVHYVNWQHAKFVKGEPAATHGKIVRQLLEAGQARGTLTFLDPTFTDTHDSAGNPWHREISYQADGFAMNLGHVHRDFADQDVLYSVTDKPVPPGGFAPGAKTHNLNMWVPGGAGVDRTATGPTLTSGQAVHDGEIVDRLPAFTSVVAWGKDDMWVEEVDAAAEADVGRWEHVVDAEQYADEPTLGDVASAAINDEQTNRKAARTELSGSGRVVPLVHFGLGDQLIWQTPPAMTKNSRPVQTITWRHGGTKHAIYTVEGSRIWDGEAALWKSVERLLDEPRKRFRQKPGPPQLPGGGGGIPDVVLAGAATKFRSDADIECDGTDDQVELDQAIGRLRDSGGWIHLLEGDYVIAGEIHWTGSGPLKITGAGKDTTTIRVANGADIASAVRVGGGFASAGDLILEDLTIDLNKGGAALVTDGIHISGGSTAALTATNVDVINGSGNGINIQRPSGSRLGLLTNVNCSGHDGGGCIAYEAFVIAHASTFSNNGSFGFATGFGGTRKLYGCTINNNGGSGIDNSGLSGGTGDVTVIGCTVDGNGDIGIDLEHFNADPSIIIGNKVRNNTGQSITAHPDSVVAHNERSGNGTDPTDPPSAGDTRQVVTFSKLGTLAIEVGTFKFVLPNDIEIIGARAAVGTAPTGADVIVDVNVNGTSIYNPPGDPQPSVPDGTEIGTEAPPPAGLKFASAGDYITVDIDQAGSTTPGEDLTVMVHFLWLQ